MDFLQLHMLYAMKKLILKFFFSFIKDYISRFKLILRFYFTFNLNEKLAELEVQLRFYDNLTKILDFY
jgi:hypothetical protein